MNSIVQDIEQSSGERNLQLTELKECGVGYEQPTENLTLREESGCVHDISEEFIRSCVSPTKFELVQETLERESERHLCALKLLSCLFSKEELATSNTDGSYAKNCLDSKRLNSLKDLVFSKFPASSTEEREKEWKTIKVKINSKCRVAKFSAKLVNMDVDEARKNARKQDEKVIITLNECLVSKGTDGMCWWRSETLKILLSNKLMIVKLPLEQNYFVEAVQPSGWGTCLEIRKSWAQDPL